MAASTPFVRSYLRKAWADAQAANETLLVRLSALNSAAVTAVASGKVLSKTAANGRDAEWTVNANEGVTPTDIVEICDRLLALYDASVAAGKTNDITRVVWMLENLVPVRRYSNDFRSMIR